MSIPTNTAATTQAGMPKKNGALGRSAAKSTSITVPMRPTPATPLVVVWKSPMRLTMAAGTTVMSATSPV